jgi:hypothetical protein
VNDCHREGIQGNEAPYRPAKYVLEYFQN